MQQNLCEDLDESTDFDQFLLAYCVALARQYGPLRLPQDRGAAAGGGCVVNDKRVERFGDRLARKAIQARRLWLADGSCIPLHAGGS